jgi:hypothetical protein
MAVTDSATGVSTIRRVLVVYYSQTGQLENVAHSIAGPLRAAGHAVTFLKLEPARPYPFPWRFWEFLDAFPESVSLDPPPLEPWHVHGPFDLILLCYTVWYLSPAPPITAFLKSAPGRALLRDTPVVTVAGCRNMWVMAQEEMKKLLALAGARHCDHVALVDSAPALATFITTPRWMLTGRKNPLYGLPAAGFTESEIVGTARFGRALARSLADATLNGHDAVLQELAAAKVDPALLFSERIGRRSFRVWGRLVRAAGPPGSGWRRPVLAVYLAFLTVAIVTVVPVSLLLRAVLQPWLRARMQAESARYERPSGSGAKRLHEFT